MIGYITSWQARLRARLYVQFRDKTNFIKIADMLAVQAQELEDAFQSLLTVLSIDDSSGEQLRVIGRRVGQANLGWSDATYRLYLKARILINKSSGTTKQLYAIFTQAFGALGYKVLYGGTKQFYVQLGSSITAAQAAAALLFVQDAKDAGARGVFQWGEFPPAQAFRFDCGPGFEVGKLIDAADRLR